MSRVSEKTTETAAPSARYAIINLIEKAGHTLGLSRPMIDHLAYLIRHTQEVDWQPGNRAIIYKSVTLMALDLGIGERQVNNREHELIDALNLAHAPSGNFRRYGHRDKETGRIVRAFGIDITALRCRLPALKAALAEQEAAKARWCDRKHELSSLKGCIRKLMDAATALGLGCTAEALQARHTDYLGRVRAETTTQEIERRILCARALKNALERVILLGKKVGQPVKTSDMSETDFRHKDPSLQKQTNKNLFESDFPVENSSPRKLGEIAQRLALTRAPAEPDHSSFSEPSNGTRGDETQRRASPPSTAPVVRSATQTQTVPTVLITGQHPEPQRTLYSPPHHQARFGAGTTGERVVPDDLCDVPPEIALVPCTQQACATQIGDCGDCVPLPRATSSHRGAEFLFINKI